MKIVSMAKKRSGKKQKQGKRQPSYKGTILDGIEDCVGQIADDLGEVLRLEELVADKGSFFEAMGRIVAMVAVGELAYKQEGINDGRRSDHTVTVVEELVDGFVSLWTEDAREERSEPVADTVLVEGSHRSSLRIGQLLTQLAVKRQHLELVEYAYERQVRWADELMDEYAASGRSYDDLVGGKANADRMAAGCFESLDDLMAAAVRRLDGRRDGSLARDRWGLAKVVTCRAMAIIQVEAIAELASSEVAAFVFKLGQATAESKWNEMVEWAMENAPELAARIPEQIER